MSEATPSLRRSPCPVVVDMPLQLGYCRQVTAGMKRFRTKRPDWLFHKRAISRLTLGEADSIRFQGAIGHFGDETFKEVLDSLGIPFYVGVSNRHKENWCAQVISDDFAVGRMAADYFIDRGFRNFAYLQESINHFAAERVAGFNERLNEAGFHNVQAWDLFDFEPATIYQDLLPLALFTVNDDAALRAMGKLLASGFQIPEDVAVLGVDDDDLVNLVSPVELSTIRLATESIGFAACEWLEHMITNKVLETGVQRFAPLKVMERRSTGGRPASDPRVRRAQAFIEDHLRHLGSVEEIAAGVGLSRRSLHRLFVDHLNTSPSDWLGLQRVKRAEILLLETDYTVEHVADLVGFEDRRRLYRAFNKLNRPLPREIRKDKK